MPRGSDRSSEHWIENSIHRVIYFALNFLFSRKKKNIETLQFKSEISR